MAVHLANMLFILISAQNDVYSSYSRTSSHCHANAEQRNVNKTHHQT